MQKEKFDQNSELISLTVWLFFISYTGIYTCTYSNWMFNDCGLELTYFSFTIIEIIIIGLLHIIACNNGTFGHNCSEQCGSCVKFGQCHHINGTCLEGCVSGFIGSTCTQRMYI